PLDVPTLEQAVRILHHPRVDSDEAALMDGSHPAWTRIKFEELLAQQPLHRVREREVVRDLVDDARLRARQRERQRR
ncbi:hypothetical protein, partial [Burkholderia cenocepacia]|uniref:hypothetical protein n=1 Tax=Burkholderia cenocepacia TaxID=95486 RepID=UPI0024B7B19A